MKKKIEIDIQIPIVPNLFVYGEDSTFIEIHECTDEELREIGRLWTEKLVEAAQKNRFPNTN